MTETPSKLILLFDVAAWILLGLGALHLFRRRKPQGLPDDTREPGQSPMRRRINQKRYWCQLLMLEYEKAADRYENIYRAIWQNFSYMAVVAGGILTFGAKELDPPVLHFLALTPLVFWLLATFLPLDHYGDLLRRRLKEIEQDLNRVYFPRVTDPRIQHFSRFRTASYRWRVREAVGLFGVFVTGFWLWFLVLAGHHLLHRYADVPIAPVYQSAQLRTKPLEVEVRDPLTAALLDSLVRTNSRVDSLVETVRTKFQMPDSAAPQVKKN